MIAVVAIIVAARDPRVLRDRVRLRPAVPVTRAVGRVTRAGFRVPGRIRAGGSEHRTERPPRPHAPPRILWHMSVEAVFGIDSAGLNTAVKLLVLFLVVIYVALIYYTYADARRRIEDPMLIGCADAASLFPFVGHDRVHDRPPAGVSRRRPRARAGDAGRRGAAAQPRLLPVPALRRRGQGGLPALPALPAQAQGRLRDLRQAAGSRRGRSARTASPRSRA